MQVSAENSSNNELDETKLAINSVQHGDKMSLTYSIWKEPIDLSVGLTKQYRRPIQMKADGTFRRGFGGEDAIASVGTRNRKLRDALRSAFCRSQPFQGNLQIDRNPFVVSGRLMQRPDWDEPQP